MLALAVSGGKPLEDAYKAAVKKMAIVAGLDPDKPEEKKQIEGYLYNYGINKVFADEGQRINLRNKPDEYLKSYDKQLGDAIAKVAGLTGEYAKVISENGFPADIVAKMSREYADFILKQEKALLSLSFPDENLQQARKEFVERAKL